MTASDPVTIPGDRTALAREAGLGRLSLPSGLGTSGTFREGPTTRVTASPGSPLGAGPFLDKVEPAGRSWPPAAWRRWPVRPPRAWEARSRWSLSGGGASRNIGR